MRGLSVFASASVLLALSSCGEAVPIDRQAMNVENEARETTRQAEVDVNTAVRAREDDAFERDQANAAAAKTLEVQMRQSASDEVTASTGSQD